MARRPPVRRPRHRPSAETTRITFARRCRGVTRTIMAAVGEFRRTHSLEELSSRPSRQHLETVAELFPPKRRRRKTDVIEPPPLVASSAAGVRGFIRVPTPRALLPKSRQCPLLCGPMTQTVPQTD